MRYLIWDNIYCMPISCQPDDGYTLSEALARYTRETRETMALFNVPKKEANSYFSVIEWDRHGFGKKVHPT